MGGIGNCCCSCWTVEELPTLSIPSMHSQNGWQITQYQDTCCATIQFVFDVPPAWTKIDGGDIMTFDKGTTQKFEIFDNPVTCLNIVVNENDPLPVPTYTGCCSDPVVVDTVTWTTRYRGGKRFVVQYRLNSITLAFEKKRLTCSGVESEKIVATSRATYEAGYEYADYYEDEATCSHTSNKPCYSCANRVRYNNRNYPFSLSLWSPSNTYQQSGGFEFCRTKVLDALPTGGTTQTNPTSPTASLAPTTTTGSLTFNDDDRGDPNCGTVPALTCGNCTLYSSDVCFDSGPTGPTEPSFGFCRPVRSGIRTTRWFASGFGLYNTCARATYTYDTSPASNCFTCEQLASYQYCKDHGFLPPDPCVQTSSYVEISPDATTGDNQPLYANQFKTSLPAGRACDTLPLSCDCPGQLVQAEPGYARQIMSTTNVQCSGYVRRQPCTSFVPWSFTVNGGGGNTPL